MSFAVLAAQVTTGRAAVPAPVIALVESALTSPLLGHDTTRGEPAPTGVLDTFVFHGTGHTQAMGIARTGVQPSVDGDFGPGIYATQDILTAADYALLRASSCRGRPGDNAGSARGTVTGHGIVVCFRPAHGTGHRHNAAPDTSLPDEIVFDRPDHLGWPTHLQPVKRTTALRIALAVAGQPSPWQEVQELRRGRPLTDPAERERRLRAYRRRKAAAAGHD